LFAIIRAGGKTFAATIEGKVDESFDRPMDEWIRGASPGKQERLSFIDFSLYGSLCRVMCTTNFSTGQHD
jgi:hypothetical protein